MEDARLSGVFRHHALPSDAMLPEGVLQRHLRTDYTENVVAGSGEATSTYLTSRALRLCHKEGISSPEHQALVSGSRHKDTPWFRCIFERVAPFWC